MKEEETRLRRRSKSRSKSEREEEIKNAAGVLVIMAMRGRFLELLGESFVRFFT